MLLEGCRILLLRASNCQPVWAARQSAWLHAALHLLSAATPLPLLPGCWYGQPAAGALGLGAVLQLLLLDLPPPLLVLLVPMLLVLQRICPV